MAHEGELDMDKIDEMALALLYLTLHDLNRAWKELDWAVFNRLYDKHLIEDPKNKNKSVVFTEEGLAEAERLFKLYCLKESPS